MFKINYTLDSPFRIFNSRLALFKEWSDTPESWESRWLNHHLEEILKKYSTGYLGEFEIFVKYLPKELPILEAGCGLGQLVMALTARGYKVKGIDYAKSTIEKIKNFAPYLDVSVGDVYSLDIPDGTLGGYISIGVFEHNFTGPAEGLREARRVLHPDGIAFISVPFLNIKRKKLLHQVPLANSQLLRDGLQFYQYYFSYSDFETILHNVGLTAIDAFPYAVSAGLTRDFFLGRWLISHGFFFWRIHRIFNRLCINAPLWMRWSFAHMIMFVCKKVI